MKEGWAVGVVSIKENMRESVEMVWSYPMLTYRCTCKSIGLVWGRRYRRGRSTLKITWGSSKKRLKEQNITFDRNEWRSVSAYMRLVGLYLMFLSSSLSIIFFSLRLHSSFLYVCMSVCFYLFTSIYSEIFYSFLSFY